MSSTMLIRSHGCCSRSIFMTLKAKGETWLNWKAGLIHRSIECEVASETQVSFRNEVMSLSKAAAIVLEEMGYNWGTVAGPAFWCYHGETLNDLRLQEEQLRNV